MCANCGFPATIGHWTEAGALTGFDRLRARLRRRDILARVLEPYGLVVHDDGQMAGFSVATRTGAAEMVEDLEALWKAAERLTGRVVDPLDPRFVQDRGL